MSRLRTLAAVGVTTAALTALSAAPASANTVGFPTGSSPSDSREAELKAALDRVWEVVTADRTTERGSSWNDWGGSSTGYDPAGWDTTSRSGEAVTFTVTGLTSRELNGLVELIDRLGGEAQVEEQESDSGTGFDTGFGSDVGTDAGTDFGTDTGTDFGTDLGTDFGTDLGTGFDTTGSTDGISMGETQPDAAGDADSSDAGDCEDDTGKDPQGNPCVDDEDDEGGNDSEGSE